MKGGQIPVKETLLEIQKTIDYVYITKPHNNGKILIKNKKRKVIFYINFCLKFTRRIKLSKLKNLI